MFCTHCQSLISSIVLQRGGISGEDWFFSQNWLSFLFWHWSSIRVLRIKSFWENRLLFKWGNISVGWCSNWPGAVLYFVDDEKIYNRQWTMSYHPQSANRQGSQLIGGNVSLTHAALSLIFWVHLSLFDADHVLLLSCWIDRMIMITLE